MSDISRCLRDGYSTGGMPGTGLGAVQCLSTDFSAFSSPGKGTAILSRTWVPAQAAVGAQSPRARFAYAGICVAASGEVVSGDAWDIRVEDGHATVIVADGLGHGPVAAEAAAEALKVFESARGSSAAILERAHPLMRVTRGAAVTLATVDANAGTITDASAGNISGRVISGIEDHALVVLHSDGLITRWTATTTSRSSRCTPSSTRRPSSCSAPPTSRAASWPA